MTMKVDVSYPTGGGMRPNEFKVRANIDGILREFNFYQ